MISFCRFHKNSSSGSWAILHTDTSVNVNACLLPAADKCVNCVLCGSFCSRTPTATLEGSSFHRCQWTMHRTPTLIRYLNKHKYWIVVVGVLQTYLIWLKLHFLLNNFYPALFCFQIKFKFICCHWYKSPFYAKYAVHHNSLDSGPKSTACQSGDDVLLENKINYLIINVNEKFFFFNVISLNTTRWRCCM